jgi:hypothetical protein
MFRSLVLAKSIARSHKLTREQSRHRRGSQTSAQNPESNRTTRRLRQGRRVKIKMRITRKEENHLFEKKPFAKRKRYSSLPKRQLWHGTNKAGHDSARANQTRRAGNPQQTNVPTELKIVSICRTLFRRSITSPGQCSPPNNRHYRSTS